MFAPVQSSLKGKLVKDEREDEREELRERS